VPARATGVRSSSWCQIPRSAGSARTGCTLRTDDEHHAASRAGAGELSDVAAIESGQGSAEPDELRPDGDVVSLLRHAAAGALEKKGDSLLALYVGPTLVLADAFLLVTGTSARHVKTLADGVQRQVKVALGRRPKRVEGLDEAAWVLLDYGEVVVHLFQPETRALYGLERLWADAAVVPLLDRTPSPAVEDQASRTS
jgi:ribosome-associated protein